MRSALPTSLENVTMSGDAIPISLPKDTLHINSGKELLGRFQEWLKERFLAGDSVVELVAARSHFIDELLCKLWEQYGLAREPPSPSLLASSAPRPSRLTTTSPTAVSRAPKTQARCAPRARTTSSKTAT